MFKTMKMVLVPLTGLVYSKGKHSPGTQWGSGWGTEAQDSPNAWGKAWQEHDRDLTSWGMTNTRIQKTWHHLCLPGESHRWQCLQEDKRKIHYIDDIFLQTIPLWIWTLGCKATAADLMLFYPSYRHTDNTSSLTPYFSCRTWNNKEPSSAETLMEELWPFNLQHIE